MSFEKFVCWNLDMVHRVMNVEATQPEKHLFLATHHPIAMYRQQLINASSQVEYNEQQFLRDFLAEKDFAFVPVLGGSGTGKSHLIRWLDANIESTEKRKVLLIPKIGTNLKDIITLILNEVEGERFDEYRERVNRATYTLTETQARVRLLNELAAASSHNGNRDITQLTDEQNYLVEKLDSFLHDPFFREYWLKDDGIIHRLITHTLGYKDKVEIIEERQGFSIEDLPIDILNWQKSAAKTQEFYTFLISNESFQKTTVEWLNEHLNEAIKQVLSLGREDLQRLMREVRETLAEQGVELVLLIEDFAKLQGIDREVLEAVLARPQQPGSKPLCAIRTALACTTGYFQSLIDTVQQRITFSVNLDIGTVDNQSLITQDDIQEFVSRYLNTVRLENQVISDWAKNNQEEDSQQESIVSACNDCEHREACHAGFGNVNDMGLYPFTPKALEQMWNRVNTGNFNPRILIKDVLKYTLENGFNDIKKGNFPSVTLREHFGKVRLNTMLQTDIRTKDPYNTERRAILIDLWTDSDELCDLPASVHTAFSLPTLGAKIQQTENKRTIPNPQNNLPTPRAIEAGGSYITEPKSVDKEPEIPETLQKKLKILDNWNNESILPQDISQNIRTFLFPAIVEKIQLDNELLLENFFASNTSKYFKQKNIQFSSPRFSREKVFGVKLLLPLNPDDKSEFLETAVAFQGILLYSHHKNWKFPNGDRYFLTYSKLLEKWSQYVLKAIRLYPRESGEIWNPVPAAVELLAIAATMGGHPTNSLENFINALFLDLDRNDTGRSQSWEKLFKSLKKHRDELLEIVQTRIACTKGSSRDFQIIDSIQIIDHLENIRKSWQPKCEIPEDVSDKFSEIYNARKDVDELLEKSIEEEYQRQFEIYQLLVSELGENFNKKEVIDTVNCALQNAQIAGVLRGVKSIDDINKIIDQFRRTAITKYQENMRRIQAEKEAENARGKILVYLSEDFQKVISDSKDFLNQTDRFLEASTLEAKNKIGDLGKLGQGSVNSCHQGIKDDLAKLQNLLNEIKG